MASRATRLNPGPLGDERMENHGHEARAQLFGLAYAYLTVDDVIAWADRAILESARPADKIVAVATSPRDRDELHRRLYVVVGSFELNPEPSAVLKSMRETLGAHPERAGNIARALLHLFANGNGQAASEARHVEYAFELAEDDVQGDRASATAELQEFLSRWS